MERQRNLSLKLNDDELARVHALAAEGDESVGRLVRRWIAQQWERAHGAASPPKPRIRIGRPRKKK